MLNDLVVEVQQLQLSAQKLFKARTSS